MRFNTFDEMLHCHDPESVAVCYDSDGETRYVTYSSLCSIIEKRANYLLCRDYSSVGIVCNSTFKCIVEIFAAVKAKKRIVLLGENVSAEQISAADINELWADDNIKREFEYLLKPCENRMQYDSILFFTSGTVSSLKAVELSEYNLCSSAYNGSALLPLDKNENLMCMLPLNHVFGFVCGLLWGLYCGCRVSLGRGIRHYYEDLKYFTPTVLPCVPMTAEFFLNNGLINSDLKLVLIGAGSCSKKVIMGYKDRGLHVAFGYGLTETASGVALSIGDDPFAMTICPDDEIIIADDGEILIKSDTCMMKGYFNDPETTEKVFYNGYLKTGDIGFIDDNGYLHVTGRKKEIIVLSDGTKVLIPEYENLLSDALTGLDYTISELGGHPVLVIGLSPFNREKIFSLIEHILKKIPVEIRISDVVFLDYPLPRTLNGKIKRGKLDKIIRGRR